MFDGNIAQRCISHYLNVFKEVDQLSNFRYTLVQFP